MTFFAREESFVHIRLFLLKFIGAGVAAAKKDPRLYCAFEGHMRDVGCTRRHERRDLGPVRGRGAKDAPRAVDVRVACEPEAVESPCHGAYCANVDG